MAVATQFSVAMAQLANNAGGQIQMLPPVTYMGARERVCIANITLAAQAAGTTIGIARLPLHAAITGINLITDTSLGSATIAIGDANTANAYAPAQTLTSVNTLTKAGTAAAYGHAIDVGYDCVSGTQSQDHEDITLTTAAAALPANGTLTIIVEYALD